MSQVDAKGASPDGADECSRRSPAERQRPRASEPPASLRRLGGVLLGFCVVLGAVEASVRMPRFNRLPIVQNELFHKIAWLKKEPASEYLIVGDSTGHRGIDARLFGQAAGGRTVNGAYTSGTPIVVRAVLAEIGWRPRTLVFTLSPLLLSDAWASEPHEVEVSTLRERIALIGAGPAILGTLWATYRRRSHLRALVGAARARRFPAPEVVDDSSGSAAVDLPIQLSESAARSLWKRWQNGGPPRRGVRLAALHLEAAKWQAAGLRVVYVLMPIAASLRRVAGEDPVAAEFPLATLGEVTAAHGGEILDCRDAVPDEGFYDVDHLRKGPVRDAFSRHLGRRVAGKQGDCGRVATLEPGSTP